MLGMIEHRGVCIISVFVIIPTASERAPAVYGSFLLPEPVLGKCILFPVAGALLVQTWSQDMKQLGGLSAHALKRYDVLSARLVSWSQRCSH
jgi:formate hydrogenlyase subunit 3/multisubunit Na+/H+ antiporter MnhD subunit